MNKIIFGGGFDPIHLGHINMALVARDTLKGEVIFVPAKVAIWKEESISEEHKLNMLRLAIAKYDGFSIDTYELEQKEQPRSYQTVAYFKKKYPNDKLFFLIGQDQANAFDQWMNPDEIAGNTHIVYYKRPKYFVNQANVDKYNMLAIEGPVVDVASSDVRALKSVAVPEEVLNMTGDEVSVQVLTDTLTNTYEPRTITIGLSDGMQVEVTSGLKKGEQVRGHEIIDTPSKQMPK